MMDSMDAVNVGEGILGDGDNGNDSPAPEGV
jgi:hypothetical protein